MGPGTAITSASSHLTNFSGRATRSEFWWWYLLMFVTSIIVMGVVGAALGALASDGVNWAGLGVWLFLIGIIFQLLIIGVGCRRLHDRGLSGWFQLLLLFSGIGTIILLILWLLPGSQGDNKYGAVPAA